MRRAERKAYAITRAAIMLAIAVYAPQVRAGEQYYRAPLKWVEGNGGGGSGPPPCSKIYESMEECIGAIMDPTCSIYSLSTFNSAPEIGYAALCTIPKYPERAYNNNVFYSCSQPSPRIYTVHQGLCRRVFICDDLHYPVKGKPSAGEFCPQRTRHPLPRKLLSH